MGVETAFKLQSKLELWRAQDGPTASQYGHSSKVYNTSSVYIAHQRAINEVSEWVTCHCRCEYNLCPSITLHGHYDMH